LSGSDSEPDAEQQAAANAALWKQANTGLTYVLPVPSSHSHSSSSASSSHPVPPANTVFAPALQILKRPTVGSPAAGKTEKELDKGEVEKNLRERERGYAEARERIFGSAVGEGEGQGDGERKERAKREGVPAAGEVVRQPKGPEEGARGFGDRGRGRGRGRGKGRGT